MSITLKNLVDTRRTEVNNVIQAIKEVLEAGGLKVTRSQFTECDGASIFVDNLNKAKKVLNWEFNSGIYNDVYVLILSDDKSDITESKNWECDLRRVHHTDNDPALRRR